MTKSRKTTWSGLLAALGAVLLGVGQAFQNGQISVEGADLSSLPMIGAVLMAVGTALAGTFSRDDDVSSEGKKLVKRGENRVPEP